MNSVISALLALAIMLGAVTIAGHWYYSRMQMPAGEYLLAIVVGHEEGRPGAKGVSPPFPEGPAGHEYLWNSGLARMIEKNAGSRGIKTKTFFRDGIGVEGAYLQVKQWYDEHATDTPKAAVELHFNANAGDSQGTVTLYGGPGPSRLWARTLQSRIASVYSRDSRTDHGIRKIKPGGRGRANVTQVHPSALIEPFFGDNYIDALLGIERKPQLAEAIIFAFIDMFGSISEVNDDLFYQIIYGV
jgi:hypothetical protein